MMILLRHLLVILLLPCVVVVAVPHWLSTPMTAIDTRWGGLWPVGTALFACGLALFAWCVGLFARLGRGTLAPWDPTRRLVAVGPYRHVRNPMIGGVAAMLLGETLMLGSWVLGLWPLAFVLINHMYFVVSEEPGLTRRFGESYRIYEANVPRWLPRWTPWQGA